MFLLDTNACIAILNGSSDTVIAEVRAHEPRDVRICSVVKAELMYGAMHSQKVAENLRLLIRFFEGFTSLPFDDLAAEQYGRIRAHLASIGSPIGPNDLMIAAIAVAEGLTLVTRNTREFARVPGLKLVDWHE